MRANATRTLVAGGPDQGPTLANLLTDSAQPLRVRQEAAIALGQIGGTDAVQVLVAVLAQLEEQAGQETEQLRIAVVHALGAAHSPIGRDALARHAALPISTPERVFTTRAMR